MTNVDRIRTILLRASRSLLHIAYRIRSDQHTSLDERYQVGVIGLINAIELFDPAVGVKFGTYAFKAIKYKIIDYCKESGTIRVPKMHGHSKYCHEKASLAHQTSYLSNKVLDQHSLGREPLVNELDDLITNKERIAKLPEALSKLDPRSRQIIELRLQGYMPQAMSEIMGITRQRIKQLEDKAKEKLAIYLRSEKYEKHSLPNDDGEK